MNLFGFLTHCRMAWLIKQWITSKITEQEKITVSELAKLYHLDLFETSIAVAYLLNCGEIAVVGFKAEEETLSAQYSSREYLRNVEERLRAEQERVLRRVREGLPEMPFTIPELARQLQEDEYSVMLNGIAPLIESGEVIPTGQSVRASDGSNIFYPTYVKSKTA